MFVGVTRQQGNRPLAHITVAYRGLGQGPRDAPFTSGGRKLRLGKVFFFFAAEGGLFLKLSLCKGVLFFFSFFVFFFQCYALFSLFSFIIADGWVIFFLLESVEVFFFPHTVGEGFFFSKNFYLLEVKWCIPKGWHVGSYLKGLDQWFSTGGA